MAIATLAERYRLPVVKNVEPRLKLELFADRDYDEIVTAGGTKAVYTVRTAPTTTVSAVDPDVGPDGVVQPDETAVEIPMYLYHKNVMPVTIKGSLYGTSAAEPNRYLTRAVRDQSRMAAQERNDLAKAALFEEIPDADATSYTWGTGAGAKTYTAVCTGTETRGGHSLVYNGTAATSDVSIAAVTTTDLFNDLSWCDKFYAQLVDNGAEPVMTEGGEDFFSLILPSNVWANLRGVAGVEDDLRHLPWNGTSAAVTNTIPALRGFVLNIVPKEQCLRAGAGLSGVDVYSCLFHGKGYMARAGLPASGLPIVEEQAQNVMRIQADDVTEIRVTPQGDKFAGNVDVAAMTYIGYGILLPEAGIKFNVYG